MSEEEKNTQEEDTPEEDEGKAEDEGGDDKKEAEESPSKGKTVLVIEDEKPIAKALQLKLSHAGYDVDVAHNGKDGLEKISDGGHDLIILDLIMPELDGFGVLEKMEKENVPVFVLSNLSQEEDKKRVEELGADKFFIKSNIQIADVIKEVEKKLS